MREDILIVLLNLLVFLICCKPVVGYYRCDGTPDFSLAPPSPSNTKFMLRIVGNPHLYVPGEKYSGKSEDYHGVCA